ASYRLCCDPGGVQSSIRLCDGKAGFLLATYDRTSHPPLLLLRADNAHGVEPEDVDLHRRSTLHPAAACSDRQHHPHLCPPPEPGAAVLFRHRDAQPSTIGDSAIELMREFAFLILLSPIIVAEIGANSGYAVSDILVRLLHRKFH